MMDFVLGLACLAVLFIFAALLGAMIDWMRAQIEARDDRERRMSDAWLRHDWRDEPASLRHHDRR